MHIMSIVDIFVGYYHYDNEYSGHIDRTYHDNHEYNVHIDRVCHDNHAYIELLDILLMYSAFR